MSTSITHFHFADAFAVVGFPIASSQKLTIQNTIFHNCSDTSGTFRYFVALNSNANYGNAGRGDSVQIYRFRTAACFRFLPFFFLLKFRNTLAKQRNVSNNFDGNCSSKPQLREDTEFLFSVLTVNIYPYRLTYCSFTSYTNLCSLCIFHRLILIIALPSLRPMYR